MPLELILTIQGHFGSCRANLGPLVMFWTILGPPGVPKRPQSGPMWHIMMYYTCEKCFRATWTLPGRLLACWSISASGLLSWATNLNFETLKNFWWRYKKKQYIIINNGPWGSFWCDLSHIWDDVFEKNRLLHIPYFGPKRPFFGPEAPVWAPQSKNIVLEAI